MTSATEDGVSRPEHPDGASRTIGVFIVDDHELVRRGLVSLLNSTDDLRVVGEAGTAEQARRRIPQVMPQVALLDGRLPDGSGIDVCRDIRSALPELGCLILTSYDDDEALFAAVMAGASGYLLKQIGGTSLTSAIRAVAAGESLIDPTVSARLVARLDRPASERDSEELTDRERQILELVAEGLTNRQIGNRMYLAEKTIKNYVSALLSKLGMQRRTQIAVYGARLRRRNDQG